MLFVTRFLNKISDNIFIEIFFHYWYTVNSKKMMSVKKSDRLYIF